MKIWIATYYHGAVPTIMTAYRSLDHAKRNCEDVAYETMGKPMKLEWKRGRFGEQHAALRANTRFAIFPRVLNGIED